MDSEAEAKMLQYSDVFFIFVIAQIFFDVLDDGGESSLTIIIYFPIAFFLFYFYLMTMVVVSCSLFLFFFVFVYFSIYFNSDSICCIFGLFLKCSLSWIHSYL